MSNNRHRERARTLVRSKRALIAQRKREQRRAPPGLGNEITGAQKCVITSTSRAKSFRRNFADANPVVGGIEEPPARRSGSTGRSVRARYISEGIRVREREKERERGPRAVRRVPGTYVYVAYVPYARLPHIAYVHTNARAPGTVEPAIWRRYARACGFTGRVQRLAPGFIRAFRRPSSYRSKVR